MPFPFDLDKIMQSVSKIKLKGGTVGKICYVLIFIALFMTTIALIMRNIWVSFMALSLMFILVFTFLWRLISFANQNPQAALMEGAELLIHEQIKMGTKNQPTFSVIEGQVVPSAELDLSKEELDKLQAPDPEPPKKIADGKGKGENHG